MSHVDALTVDLKSILGKITRHSLFTKLCSGISACTNVNWQVNVLGMKMFCINTECNYIELDMWDLALCW